MPEIIPEHVPDPRTALFWDGVAYRPGIIDGAGHVQIDVISTVMDALAATAANQALILAQLQLIENIRNALLAVSTDYLLVRGAAQLFNIEQVTLEYTTGAISGASGYFASAAVPANRYWVITNVRMADQTTATTIHTLSVRHGGADVYFGQNEAAFGANAASIWNGHVYLAATDVIRVWFAGGLVGDTCHVWISGYQMIVE